MLPNSICALPFMHTYITANGSMVSCCEAQELRLAEPQSNFMKAWNSEAYLELRKQFLEGERPSSCKKCWDNEEKGVFSNRQQVAKDLATGFYGENVEVNYSIEQHRPPISIEVKCNNLCNLKCRMCHPESNFRIAEDKEIIGRYRNIEWPEGPLSSQTTVQALLALPDSELRQIRHFQFSGGEPLLSREQVDLVRRLLKFDPENIHLRYATNLTHLKFEDFDYLEMWKKFRAVNIKVSADGIGDVYNYVRVGADFDKLTDNIKRLLDKKPDNLNVNMGFTTQAYNVYQLPEYFEFFSQLLGSHQVHQYLLHSPKFMHIGVLPDPWREKVIEKLRPFQEFQALVRLLQTSSSDVKNWDKLVRYTHDMESKYKVEKGFEYLLEKYL